MIKLTNVSKYYHSNNSVALALRKVNLELNKGEFVAITGESGSGKTTLLNVISGADTYEEGELYINGNATSHFGKEDWELYRKKYISFIYQAYNLIDSYTAIQNIETALLIYNKKKELSKKEVREKAMYFLDKVGLSNVAKSRASQLSSGQKQRLAIARALSKETDILIADEPTGNLDVENSEQIMQLLYDLSKEKLVIVVTHNFEEAKDYASRKLRLFDGEIIDDMKLREPHFVDELKDEVEKSFQAAGKTKKEKKTYDPKPTMKKRIKAKLKHIKTAGKFLRMNKLAQPKRNGLILSLMLFISLSFYIFFGSFATNLDGATSKVYSDKAFANGSLNRLVVRNMDSSIMDEEDVKAIKDIKYVEEIDLFDSVNDINYFYKENDDYKKVYKVRENEYYDMPDHLEIEFLKYDQFMRSAKAIDEKSLIKGEIADELFEVVVGKDYKDMQGKTIEVYLCNKNMWTERQYIKYEFKVVGVSNSNDSQMYFSEELCRILSANTKSISSRIDFPVTSQGKGADISLVSSMTESFMPETLFDATIDSVIGFMNPIFVPNTTLEDNNVMLSERFYEKNVKVNSNTGQITQYKIAPGGILSYVPTKLESEGTNELATIYKQVKVLSSETQLGSNVVEVSKEFFDSIFPSLESKQLSVFIEDFAYTEDVLELIRQKGYDAISVYKVGATTLDPVLVSEKLTTMTISFIAIIVIFFLGMMITYMMMKLKKSDFIIFKSIGMDQKMIREINFVDVIGTMIVCFILTLLITFILNLMGFKQIADIYKYYRIHHILILAVINFIFANMISRSFTKYLSKKTTITSLKED